MQFVRNLLSSQRQRAVGMLMTYIETSVYPRLPEAERRELRRQVLRAIDGYHGVALDVVKSSVNDGSVVNEEFVLTIAGLSEDIRLLREDLVED